MSAHRYRITSALAALAAGAAAVPAAASAATLAPVRTCFLPGQLMVLAGSGYTPGDTIAIEGEAIFASATADAAGQILIPTQAPPLPFSGPGDKSFAVTALDETTGAGAVAGTTVNVTNFAVATKPAQARPTTRVKFFFSGFATGKQIYGHFFLRGKLRATARYGRAHGPCGVLTTHTKLYPGRHARFGLYKVQFDDRRHYSKHSIPRLVTKLHIYRHIF